MGALSTGLRRKHWGHSTGGSISGIYVAARINIDAHADGYPDAYADTDIHAYADANGDPNGHRYRHSHQDANGYTYQDAARLPLYVLPAHDHTQCTAVVPGLDGSTSPRLGEKATYYSGVCLETGEVESMLVTENCNAETSTAFLRQLRAKHTEPLIVIWDNSPAHRGPEIREYLTTPDLRLRFVALPAYSPDFNPDEAIWDWARQEVTANTCFGTAAKVRERLDAFFVGLAGA